MIDRAEFLEHIRLVRDDIREVNDRLDRLNGRTREAEEDIVVLKDRSQGRSAMVAGGSVGALFVGLAELVRWWTGK